MLGVTPLASFFVGYSFQFQVSLPANICLFPSYGKRFCRFLAHCVKPEAGFLQPLMVRNTNNQEADIPERGVSAS